MLGLLVLELMYPLPKSIAMILVHAFQGGLHSPAAPSPTLVEVAGELQRANELGVEARSHLHAHAAAKEPQVHEAQIGLLVPRRGVLLQKPGDHGVTGVSSLDDTHLCRRIGAD